MIKQLLCKSLAFSGLALTSSCATAQNAPVAPRAPRPNIVLIMADDMGFSDIGCYGGEIGTPNIDQIAREGVRFTRFTNEARCCPTRAALMTGLYPHQAGIGGMNYDLGLPAYQGELNNQCVTLAEMLKGAGYSTYATGKWHLTTFEHNNPKTEAGKANWPLQRGFDDYYGIIAGADNYFHPATLTKGNQRLPKPGDDYYTTDAFSDYTAKTIEAQPKNKPFFFYVSYNAPHWPLQAKPADLAKYKGKFDAGWDVLRQQRYERMIKMGLLEPSWDLSPHERDWATTPGKAELLRKMETYAAMVDSMDQGVGKIVSALKKSGQYNNTLLIFLSDNGACHEGASYGVPWANLSNTPFRLYKHWTHEGGIATPMIAHWPARIQGGGGWNGQIGNVMDFMATFADVAGATYPTTYHGHKIPPMEGTSLVPAFENKPLNRAPLFWEHEGNRAVIEGNWKLVSAGNRNQPPKWELYDLSKDRSEMHDLIGAQPARATQMAASWDKWAARVHVFPMPNGPANAAEDEEAPDAGDVAASVATPQIAGKTLDIRCDVTTTAQSGVILAQGGAQAGYALHLAEGKLIFSVRENGVLTTTTAPDALGGKFSVEAQLQKDGAMILSVGGKIVARAKAPSLIKVQPKDELSIGQDTRGAVGDYRAPNRLAGTVENVKIVAE